jgi:hypothetical protein
MLIVNSATDEPAHRTVARKTVPSAQLREMLQQQRQLLSELVSPIESPDTAQPKPAALQPRSQRREEFFNA